MSLSVRSFQPADAKGVGPGLQGYARAAPTHPHLGWTPAQVEQRTQGAGRALKDVHGAMDVYQVPRRGLNHIPREVFADARVRIDQYIKPLKTLPERFNITDPAQAQNPQAWRQAAQGASEYRNQLMESVRERISAKGLGASQAAKAVAPTFEQVWSKAETAVQKAQGAAYDAMTPAQREIVVSQKIIQNAGKTDPTFNALVQGADDAGRGLQVLKHGGRALVAVGAVMDGASVTREVQDSLKTGNWDNTGKEVSRVAGGWLGAAAAGAAVGAVSGTIVPGLGNVTGFLVGAAAGAVGYWLGSQGGAAAYQAIAH